MVSNDEDDRNAIGPRLEQCHRRVEQTDGAVYRDEHRLAGGLGVAVRHRYGRLLVQTRQQLWCRVLAVVDQRFVEALERRARIDGGVLEADLLEHVHHEVRCRPALRGDARRRGDCALRRRVGEVVGVGDGRQRDR